MLPGKSSVLSTLVALVSLAGVLNAQNTPPAGISYEEALAQANALLREHGIDPTGEGMGHDSDHGDHADHDHAPVPADLSASTQAAVEAVEASGGSFTPLTLAEIQADPDVWPAEVVMLEHVDFTSGLRLTPGNVVNFAGFERNGDALLDYGETTLTLPANYTDLVERANDVARGQAKAEGFRGRLLEQLDGRIVVPEGRSMRRTSSDVIAGGNLYVLYMSSEACGWCRRFTPDFVDAMDRLERRYPGQVKVIHASVDRNMSEFQTKYATVEADAAIPPGDRWYINAYSALHPGVSQIAQPSLMVMNVNGRLIDSAMRQNRDTSAIEGVLDRMSGYLNNVTTVRPAWIALDAPLQAPSATVAPAVLAAGPLPDIIPVTDTTIAGPEPYPATLRDGTVVPGLVIYDRKSSGGRIPALTLQAYPRTAESEPYYVLAFREVLGQTFGSKPLLKAMLQTVTTRGSDADADLAMRVQDFKDLHAKFNRWRQTAIDNGVSEFRKEIAIMPQTRVENRVVLTGTPGPNNPKAVENELEVIFIVQSEAQHATMRTQNFTWSRAEMDAYQRLMPQIGALISQMPHEIIRVAQERENTVQELQDVDSLFQ